MAVRIVLCVTQDMSCLSVIGVTPDAMSSCSDKTVITKQQQ